MTKHTQSTAIDISRKFPILANAPIVEAIIEWRAEPRSRLKVDDLSDRLTDRFPNYQLAPIHDIEATLAGSGTDFELAQHAEHTGFRLTATDGLVVCQFRPNMVTVSRLAPYEGWEAFFAHAEPFRQAFTDWCQPSEYSRVGVRSISKIPVPRDMKASALVAGIARPWRDFGIESTAFFQQDTVAWPDSPYTVRLVRAMDGAPEPSGRTLYVDIDVSTQDSVALPDTVDRLAEMRFLKNLVFFSTLCDATNRFG